MRNTMIKKLLLNQGKWETVQGIPPLTLEKSLGKNLRDYKIYGNSIQNGTPTPDAPIEVESIGEFDETTGKYKIPIVTQGKNLIDVPDYQDNLNGVPAPNYDITNICPRDVTISFSAILKRDVFVGDNDKRVRINYVVDGTTKYIYGYGKERSVATGIVPNNATSVSITFQKLINTNGNLFWQNAQLELGSTATDFEPYQEPIETNIYLDEPLRKIGDYADYIDFENGVVVRNIKQITLDGVTEEWEVLSGSNAPHMLVLADRENVYVGTLNIKSTHFETVDNAASWSKYSSMLSVSAINPKNIVFRYTAISSLDEFKEWLSNNNVEVSYKLATPTETQIELPKLPTLKGTTVLDTKTNLALSNMSVVYKRR